MDRCYSFHNVGRVAGSVVPRHGDIYPILGSKCRMAEYQAAILIRQLLEFVEEESGLVPGDERLLGSSEFLESIIVDKDGRLAGEVAEVSADRRGYDVAIIRT